MNENKPIIAISVFFGEINGYVKFTEDLDENLVKIDLNLFYLEMNSTNFIKIDTFELGDFDGFSGKILNKALNKVTPKTGCFIISILDVLEQDGKKLDSGSIQIDYSLFTTSKKQEKEKLIQLQKMNDKISIY
jgi:hypothetical protein